MLFLSTGSRNQGQALNSGLQKLPQMEWSMHWVQG